MSLTPKSRTQAGPACTTSRPIGRTSESKRLKRDAVAAGDGVGKEAGATGPQTALASRGTSGRLLPVQAWNEYHAWPPVGGLRHLIFFSETNGFDKVIRRVGRRVLIDESAFFSWVNSQGGVA